MNVQVKDVPPRHVAYLRGYGPYPETLPKLWHRFNPIAISLGFFARGGAVLSIMHDDMNTVPPEKLRGDAAIEVPPDWQPAGGLQTQTIPGGLFALAEHQGSYTTLSKTWGDLFTAWLPTSGYRVRPAASYEIYLNDPTNTPPADLRTMIHLPVQKK